MGTPLCLFFAASLLAAAPSTQWSGGGRVEYVLIHKFHEVVGVCKEVEARAKVEGEGPATIQVMARAPIRCFDSGNTNRDTNAMAAVDAAHHPLVVVKGTASGALPPPGQSATFTLDAAVELKGETVFHPIELTVERSTDGELRATFSFEELLTAHKIERPSLLMVPVEDALKLRGLLTLRRAP